MSQSGAEESAKPEELTLSQISARHHDRWVAVEVTRRDRNRQPVQGRVVAEDVDRYNIRMKTMNVADICIFYAGELPFRLHM
ncbi:MAG: hypothetical protein ABSG45_03535 [Nitrososphaerales archaeon]|jgi:hypothetical protein